MKKEDVLLLAQLLQTMKELYAKIRIYYRNRDSENLASAKREMLSLQRKIENILA